MHHRLCGALAAAVIVAGCNGSSQVEEAPAAKVEGSTITFPSDSPQRKALVSEPVSLRPVPARTVNGRLVWNEDRTVRIYSPFAGRVERIAVQVGDTVRPGQLLAAVASPEFGQAQAEARRAEGEFVLAEKNLARVRELQTAGVAPAKDLNAAEAEHARAAAERSRAAARLKLYGGGEAVNQQFALTSPIAGTVVERTINPGQEIRPDQNAPGTPALFVITDPRYLWAVLDAQEEDLPRIGVGDAIRVRSPAFPGETFEAKVTAVADFLDPVTRVIKVRASLDNSHRKLKGEMFVVAEVAGEAAAHVAVPTRAVFFSGGRHYAFTDDGDGRYTRREIRIGDTDRDSIHVIEGLAEGQRVVVDGALALQQILAPRRVKKS